MANVTPGRRERAKADKRARILAAARARLRAQGYDGMTMAQVAANADVAIGTVFQYAATKAELLLMVTAAEFADALPAAVAAAGTRAAPRTLVRRFLEPLVAFSSAYPETSMAVARELLFGTSGPHRDEVVEIVAEVERAIAEVLSREGSAARAETAARLIVSGALLELNRTRTGRATPASTERRLVDLVDLILDGARA